MIWHRRFVALWELAEELLKTNSALCRKNEALHAQLNEARAKCTCGRVKT